MLRIGKLTDYAMLILGEMAKQFSTVLSAASLAEQLHLSTPTVSKILKKLAEAHLVQSVRGADGGYHLARAPESIRVAHVITAMEGTFAMTECCENICSCSLTMICTMRNNWQKINKMIYATLAEVSILEMIGTLPANVTCEES